MSLNISDDIRTALLNDGSITALLGLWNSAPSIHTRRPIPENAEYPAVIVLSRDVNDEDGLESSRPIADYDISVYGRQKQDYRSVESLGFFVRDLFHRKRFAITPSGVSVIEIVCRGPMIAPTDDASLTGRLVTLQVKLKE